ncbi:MAG: fumarate hydratase [Clostridia bacterium]|nr:fumarate hydratase [Clostridia bacterium]
MRIIEDTLIIDAVEKMCIKANCKLNEDIKQKITEGMESEISPVGKSVLCDLLENARIASEKTVPICQDTGMAVFFVQIGKELHISGRSLNDAVNEGVRRGYTNGYLRKSVVEDPLRRINTKDNTPAVVHCEFTEGDRLRIVFAPKGFGSENKSALKMLNPSDGREGVISFVVETVEKAGANPCPPMVVGIGIGGTMDKCAQLSKLALTRSVTERNPDPYYAQLEEEITGRLQRLGIGPAGMGGSTTVLGVNIEVFPTHIAGLPVSVNISCHATRHAEVII